jgi:hypothetical protein
MLQRLLDGLVDMPAVVMGRRMDILVWNAAAVALFGDYAALDRAERNIAWITFLDETSRELYADWTLRPRERGLPPPGGRTASRGPPVGEPDRGTVVEERGLPALVG